jgi:FHA domain-containing protein
VPMTYINDPYRRERSQQVPELVVQLTRAGFLALLWLFVLAALRIVRSDLYAAAGLKVAVPGFRRGTAKKARGGGKAPRQLVVTHGALAGTRISLDGRPIMIGRADDSTLVLDDDYASTRHARISLRGTDWYVEDLGSTNGTYLDRAKVTAPLRVPLGAQIRIGKTVIELRS